MNKDFIKECDRKMKEGEKKYGELDIKTDDRDWFDEMMDEIVDQANYCAMMYEKLKYLQKKFHKGVKKFNL